MQIEPVFNIRIHWFENIEWFHTDESITNREQIRAFTIEHSPPSNPPLQRMQPRNSDFVVNFDRNALQIRQYCFVT